MRSYANSDSCSRRDFATVLAVTSNALSQRRPLLNLMRVVGLSAGVVSRRTLTTLLAVAETEPYDRSVDLWVRLLTAIQAAERNTAELPRSYRRRRDAHDMRPAVRRFRSGIREKIEE